MSVGISKGHNGDLTWDVSLIKKCLWRQGERARKFGGGKVDVLFKRLLWKYGYYLSEIQFNKKIRKETEKAKWDEAVV